MKIVLFGHGKWACLTLSSLYQKGHEILGVVTETHEFDEREAESYRRLAMHNAYQSLEETADTLGLTTYRPSNIHDPGFMECIDALQPHLIVSVSYHGIFRQPWQKKYPDRIINAHLAPLPKYRGRSPLNWAIINGETHTALTVHFIDEGIDTGPIIIQEQIPIYHEDKAIDVLLRALPLFPKLVQSSIEKIESGRIMFNNHQNENGTYFPKRNPEDGLINWQTECTKDIYNKIRALSHPYPGAYSYYADRQIIFETAKISKDPQRISPVGGLVIARTQGNGVQVTTADGWLEISGIRIGDDEVPAGEQIKVGGRFT